MKTNTTLKHFFNKIALAILLAAFIIPGCKKTENNTIANETSAIDPSIISKIKELGFQTDGIREFGEYYVVEDDIMISKKSLSPTKSPGKLMSAGGKIAQANTDNLINNTNSHNINISIDESIWGNHVWYSGVLEAITAWNSTPGSNVKLNLIVSDYQYNPAPRIDIIIKGDGGFLASNVAAQAEFPSADGKPGSLILVNSDFRDPNTNYFITQGQGAWNVIHEIGHCLGLRHTNWYLRGELAGPNGANQIANTPSHTVGDANSVMNGGTALSYYSSYPALPSNYDAIAINTLYPLSTNSLIVPYIGGKNLIYINGQSTYHMSYGSAESGIYYRWKVIGINGTNYNYEYTDDTDAILNEIGFASPGTYELQCTISGGKYTTPVTATKQITVQ